MINEHTPQYGQVQVNTIQDHLNFAGGLMLAVGSAGAFITLKAVSLPVVAVTFGLAAAMTCGIKALHIADQKLGAVPTSLMGKITHEAITKFTLTADYYNLRRFDGFHALPEVADILAQRLGLKKIERFNKQELVLMEGVQEKKSPYPKIISDLYRSHPSTARRVARLKKIHNSIA